MTASASSSHPATLTFLMDLLIAATAHAHEARLYTRNAEDLAGLEGLVDVVVV